MGEKLLEGYNNLADIIVGWEVEQIGGLLSGLIQSAITNMEILLPLLGLVSLFIFKPTRYFAIGSLVLGLLLL